jgi:DivIVA domain-containing protein
MVHLDDAVRARLAQIVEEIDASTFRETKWGHRGYNERDVDEFLDYLIDVIAGLIGVPADQVVAAVSDAAPAAQPSGVTVQERPGDVAAVTWETRPSQVAVIAEPPTDTSAIVEEETAMWEVGADGAAGEFTGEYTAEHTGQLTAEHTGQLTAEHAGEHTGEYTGEFTGEVTGHDDGGAGAGAAPEESGVEFVDEAGDDPGDVTDTAGAVTVRTAFPPPPPWAGGG